MKRINYLLILLLLPIFAVSQKIDKSLEKKITNEIANFQGDIGIYVKNLKSNKEILINADTIFPTASIVKIPILIGIFQKVYENKLKLNDMFLYRDTRAYGGSGLMQFFKDSVKTDLSTLISLMLSYSDNVTSIWCQELAGGGVAINPIMDKLGLKNTKVNSRTPGREEIWKQYGWGQTTPREIAHLFELIRQGKVISPQMDEKMFRYLKNQFYNERSLSSLPPQFSTISKTGSLDDVRGEVVLVNAPHGDIVFSILTKNNKDKSWTKTNEAEELTRKLANIIWNHFEPKLKYLPFPPID